MPAFPHNDLAAALFSALGSFHGATNRERLAAQMLAGLLANGGGEFPDKSSASDDAELAVTYADALRAALEGPRRPAAAPGLVTLSATYSHLATGRRIRVERLPDGRCAWVLTDGPKTLDTGGGITEQEALAQAIAAAERPA